MKTKLMSLLFLAWSGMTMGQTLSVPDVEAVPGETVSYSLNINVGEGEYVGYQYDMQFPVTGFTLTGKTTTNENWIGGFLSVGDLVAGAAKGSAHSGSDKNIPSGDIEIGTVEFTVDPTLATGEYDVTISGFDFLDGTHYIHANDGNDVTFKVKVVAAHTVELDELSTTAPTAAPGVNVKVKRAIKANSWSTICLPFAIPAEKMTEAFGAGVEVKDFTGYDIVESGEDIVGIAISFQAATAMLANHPYLIKVANAITYDDGFTVDGVDIDPEDEPIVSFGFTTGKGSKAVYHPADFVGTYVADTTVPENDLFISNNKFYYSAGATNMKAFRAYFEFDDVLTALDEAGARISIVDEDVTGINTVHSSGFKAEGTYDLQGRKIENPKKGLYINNGKKVVVK